MVGHRLYYSGLTNIEAKEKEMLLRKYNNELTEEAELTFHPNINEVSKIISSNDPRRSKKIEDILIEKGKKTFEKIQNAYTQK